VHSDLSDVVNVPIENIVSLFQKPPPKGHGHTDLLEGPPVHSKEPVGLADLLRVLCELRMEGSEKPLGAQGGDGPGGEGGGDGRPGPGGLGKGLPDGGGRRRKTRQLPNDRAAHISKWEKGPREEREGLRRKKWPKEKKTLNIFPMNSSLHPRSFGYRGGVVDEEDGQLRDRYGFVVPAGQHTAYRRHLEHYMESGSRSLVAEWRALRTDDVLTNESAVTAESVGSIEKRCAREMPVTQELLGLVKVGVPDIFRARVWVVCSGSLSRWRTNPAQFHECLAMQAQSPSPSTEQIQKDLTRTLTDNRFFLEPEGRAALERVLLAYSHRNPTLGYTQSMNFLAGTLLLVQRSEEEAFWLLGCLVEDLFPEYYARNLLGVQIDAKVFMQFMNVHLRELSEKFTELGVFLEITVTQWFMTAYVGVLPPESVVRVWDLLFSEGPQVMFMVGLGILKHFEDAFLAAEGMEDVLPLLKGEATLQLYDVEALIELADGIGATALTAEGIQTIRRHQRELMDQAAQQQQQQQQGGGGDPDDDERGDGDGEDQGEHVAELLAAKREALGKGRPVLDYLKEKYTSDTASFPEKVCYLAGLLNHTDLDERTAFFFRSYDRKNSGCVSKVDVLQMLACFEKLTGARFHSKDLSLQRFVDKLFKNLDPSGSGTLTLPQFQKLPLADPRLVDAFLIGIDLHPNPQQGKAKRSGSRKRGQGDQQDDDDDDLIDSLKKQCSIL
jgi:Ca2+-binding EF-hand superfamily protein